MATFLFGLERLIMLAINVYSFLLIIYVFMSWIPGAYQSRLGYWLGRIVGPFLDVFNRIIPPIFGISIAPIFAFLVLEFLGYGVSQIFNLLIY